MPSQPQLILLTHLDLNLLSPISISQQKSIGYSLSRPHSPSLMQTSPEILLDEPTIALFSLPPKAKDVVLEAKGHR